MLIYFKKFFPFLFTFRRVIYLRKFRSRPRLAPLPGPVGARFLSPFPPCGIPLRRVPFQFFPFFFETPRGPPSTFRRSPLKPVPPMRSSRLLCGKENPLPNPFQFPQKTQTIKHLFECYINKRAQKKFKATGQNFTS